MQFPPDLFYLRFPMADEKDRKTLEERHQMSDLDRLRHSCAHVLATAISRIWPDAQFAAGPPVEGGFYYDLDLDHRITPDDFPAIEAEMKKVVKEMAEKGKISLRSIRRESNDKIKKMKSDKTISEDDERRAQDSIQKVTDISIKEIDKLYEEKAEALGVH